MTVEFSAFYAAAPCACQRQAWASEDYTDEQRKIGKCWSLVQEIREQWNNEFIVLGNTVKISCFLSTFALQTIKFTSVGVLVNTEMLHI